LFPIAENGLRIMVLESKLLLRRTLKARADCAEGECSVIVNQPGEVKTGS